jgi:Laminin G domain
MFDGASFLQFIGLQRTVLSFTEFEVILKPTSRDGLIFYNGYSKDRTGDFLSLALKNGYVEYRFDLGTGPAYLRFLLIFINLLQILIELAINSTQLPYILHGVSWSDRTLPFRCSCGQAVITLNCLGKSTKQCMKVRPLVCVYYVCNPDCTVVHTRHLRLSLYTFGCSRRLRFVSGAH